MSTNDVTFLENCMRYVIYLTIASLFFSLATYADVTATGTTVGALPPLYPGGTKKVIVKEMSAGGGEGGSQKMGRTMNIIILVGVVALVLFIVAVAIFMFISSRRRRRSQSKGPAADTSQIVQKESVYKAEQPPSAMRPAKAGGVDAASAAKFSAVKAQQNKKKDLPPTYIVLEPSTTKKRKI